MRIENVTYDDIGFYTCVAANTLGTTNESAYLNVVDHLPVEIEVLPVNNAHLKTMFILLSIFLTLFIMISTYVYNKHKKTKKLQRQIQSVNHCTKKVIVLQSSIESGGSGVGSLVSFTFQLFQIEIIIRNILSVDANN